MEIEHRELPCIQTLYEAVCKCFRDAALSFVMVVVLVQSSSREEAHSGTKGKKKLKK